MNQAGGSSLRMNTSGDNVMRQSVSTILLLLLVGCASVPASPPVMKATGPYQPPGISGGLVDRFISSARDASVDNPGQAKLNAMLGDGLGLVYAHCSDFFRESGTRQERLLIARDVVTTLGTLAGTALAIGNRSGRNDADSLALIAFGTSSAMAGIDVYTQRYLFGADNIDAVRELTLNALVAHADSARALRPSTYQSVTLHILDNQAICTPRRIALLARQAIQAGTVVSTTTGAESSEALARLGRVQDLRILKELGGLLNPPGSVSVEQAGAMYWLFYGSASSNERSNLIRSALKDLPDAGNPFDSTGQLKSPIPHQAAIQSAIMSLRSETRARFDEQIKAIRENLLAGGAGAPPAGELFELAPESEPVAGSRVSISVQ